MYSNFLFFWDRFYLPCRFFFQTDIPFYSLKHNNAMFYFFLFGSENRCLEMNSNFVMWFCIEIVRNISYEKH